ncbi:MAG TPA: M24 family metallopeptidase [Nocardioides sp.]|nr:M24 family metallopeptidase [Nocardioides sp.]
MSTTIAWRDGHPVFSSEEMARRRRRLLDAAEERGVSRLLVVGAERAGTAVQWVTGWPVTREAYVLVDRQHRDTLLVGFYNHVPQARELARDADVAWVGPSPVRAVTEALAARGHGDEPLGVVGPLRYGTADGLRATGLRLLDLGSVYTRLRQVKSPEELAWLREGAALSDAGVAALATSLRAGLTEHELGDLVERAYVPRGGSTHIHYFGVTPMQQPARANPAQHPSSRQVRPGDAVSVELSAAFAGYAGQVLRTFTVECDPTPLYAELHDVAERAFDSVTGVLRDGATVAEVVAAASVIEEAGFTTLDDLVHGFGGGYLPPVLGSASRDLDNVPTDVFRAGMTVVVQPNVVTRDRRAGVQTGELVLVTGDGIERLHAAPRGLRRVG